jgi:hypothetical protein
VNRVKVQGDLFHPVVPENALYIGRQTPGLPGHVLCNPHRVGKPCKETECDGATHTLSESLVLYKARLVQHYNLVENAAGIADHGIDFACWCKIGNPCHVDVLIEMIENYRNAQGAL